METGKHRQFNWKGFSKNTIKNYKRTFRHIEVFCTEKKVRLRIREVHRMNEDEHWAEKNYWENFDLRFRRYLYKEKKLFDNSVGLIMKQLRVFFRYLQIEKGINVGTYYKCFYAPGRDNEVIAVYPERLGYLIFSKILNSRLSLTQKRVKDVFIFGCVTGLRYSDLIRLTKNNLEKINDRVYLHTRSQKSGTFMNMLLPKYAIEIIERYKDWRKTNTLLPFFHVQHFNKHIQKIGEIAGWTETHRVIRFCKSEPKTIYKDPKRRKDFRYCDLLTSHSMRRTAITTMMQFGVKEEIVRRISGHRPKSKSFSHYVNYSEAFVGEELDRIDKALDDLNINP